MLLAGTSVVATLVQADRHSVEARSFNTFVPEQFRIFTLARASLQKINQARPTEAVHDAKRLVFLHPIQAESLTVLALAEHSAGNEKRSVAALTLAAERGWREPFAQQAVALAAARSGEADVAAERLIALWKTSSGRQFAYQVTPRILVNDVTIVEFTKRLDAKSYWTRVFSRWAADHLSSTVYRKVVQHSRNNGHSFRCDYIAQKVRKYLTRGLADDARELWFDNCSSNVSTLTSVVFPGVVSKIDRADDPFAWQFPPSVGLTMTVRADGSLSFTNNEPVQSILARKYLELEPGQYLLKVSHSRQVDRRAALFVKFKCRSSNADVKYTSRLHTVDGGPIKLTVPASSCGVQSLSLLVTQGSGRNVIMTLSRVNKD